jgi:hypothetical protein
MLASGKGDSGSGLVSKAELGDCGPSTHRRTSVSLNVQTRPSFFAPGSLPAAAIACPARTLRLVISLTRAGRMRSGAGGTGLLVFIVLDCPHTFLGTGWKLPACGSNRSGSLFRRNALRLPSIG